VYFSAVSIWEIAIKASLGKVNFRYSAQEIAKAALETGFTELPVTSGHGAKVVALPLHHHDPFDRLLIAQMLLIPARLLSTDSALKPYSSWYGLYDYTKVICKVPATASLANIAMAAEISPDQ
jgi:PIN domain nuclease of toxin-antitoxin system